MRAMTVEEATTWSLSAGLKLNEDDVLCYRPSAEHRFFVEAPEEFRRIMPFTRAMLTFRGEVMFSGGLVWLREWTIGTPQFTRVGWEIIEGIRRAHGDPRSLELAPAQLFRNDELSDLHAFLAQVVGFGWVAEFVPSTGGFFVHFKGNRQVCFTCESAESLNELRTVFGEWNPTEEDPMVLRLIELEKSRTRVGGQFVKEPVVSEKVMTDSNCLFCRIVAGEIPAKKVHEDEHVLAFEDIHPQAPTHILIIPKKHFAGLKEAEAADAELIGRCHLAAAHIARQRNIEQGYRTVLNVGPGAGQSVFHLHVHLLGGRPLAWPPG